MVQIEFTPVYKTRRRDHLILVWRDINLWSFFFKKKISIPSDNILCKILINNQSHIRLFESKCNIGRNSMLMLVRHCRLMDSVETSGGTACLRRGGDVTRPNRTFSTERECWLTLLWCHVGCGLGLQSDQPCHVGWALHGYLYCTRF